MAELFVENLSRFLDGRPLLHPLRFEGMAEEHRQIFLTDPSNNVLEFKQYDDPRLMY